MSKRLLPEFEHRSQPVLHPRQFIIRLAYSVLAGLALIAFSLLVGMIGYHQLEMLDWLDSFLNAAMLLGGMGPLHSPATQAGKLFAGFYALYCGLAVIVVAGVILAPVAHRLLHKLHVEGSGQ
jgi:vacuolar-type H+-ATPase subunit I/STV1